MFKLTIVTAEQTIYEGDITMLVAPSVNGEVGILTGHHPMVTKLGPGAMRIVKPDGQEERLFVSGGFLEVSDNKATLLADLVENIDEIQVTEAAAARKMAQEKLKETKDELDKAKLENELRTHLIRERLAQISQYRNK